MSVKIRLQRHGKKGKPFFHIVVADARARRDGRLIEKLGTYNPITNPATIELDVDAAVKWLNYGAQPTDTARAILSYKGALYKKHLQGGVKKGAFDDAEAERRFNAWLEEKEKQIQGKSEGLAQSKAEAKKAALEAEAKVNEARAAAAQKILDDAKAEQEAKEAEERAAKEAEEKAAQEAENSANTAEAGEENAEEKSVVETVAEKLGGAAAAVAGAVESVKDAVSNVAEKVSDAVSGDKADEKAAEA